MDNLKTCINSKPLTLNETDKSYNSIDLVKFICSLLIIVIHSQPLLEFSDAANYIFNSSVCRLAVPFFFMSTGFLVFRKIDPCNMQRGILVSFTKKILKLYLVWSIIYFLPSIYNLYTITPSISRCLIKFVRNTVFCASYVHLWYLPAVIIAVWLTYFSLKHFKKFKIVIPCALLLYVIGMLPLTYRKAFGIFFYNPEIQRLLLLLKKLFVTTRNGIFFGFIFVAIGALFACKPIKIKFNKAVILLLASVLLLVAEVVTSFFYFRSDESDFWLMIVPASFFLFYITTHIEIKNSNKYFVLRQMSSLIYFLHHFIIFSVLFINKLSLHFSNGDLQIGWFLCWVITTTVSVAVSYIIVKLSQKPRLKFLKILYT